jgi:tetratricopeptide (TPR) repeat protein
VRRALGLVPEDEVDVPLEIDRADALFFSGSPEEAARCLDAAARRAAAAGDRVGELTARLEGSGFKLFTRPEGALAELEATIAEARPELEAAGDDFGLYIFHFARALIANMRARFDEQLADVDASMYHAQRTGLPHLVAWVVPGAAAARLYGMTPLSDLLDWLDQRETQFGPDWRFAGHRAAVLALLGRFDGARRLLSDYIRAHEERGDVLSLGGQLSQNAVVLELLAGDPAAAAANAERGCRILEEAGERAWLSTGACWYAEALYQLDEAEEWAQKGAELGDPHDATTHVLALQVQAKVLARRGRHAEAESLARKAVAVADETQALVSQADGYRNLAEVLEPAGRREEAAAALREALERYERKGAVAPADRVRERLRALQPA